MKVFNKQRFIEDVIHNMKGTSLKARSAMLKMAHDKTSWVWFCDSRPIEDCEFMGYSILDEWTEEV